MADDQVGSPARAAETRVPVVLALVIVFTSLSCISVALRLYTRKVILRLVAPDDYAIIVAQVFALGVSVVNIVSIVTGGVGRHIEFVQDKLLVFSKCLFAVILIYNAAQIVTKVSLLLQYRRLFPGHHMQLICKWGMVFLGVWGVVQQIYTPFACRPLQDIFPNQKSCVPTTATFTVNAVMNMLTDFVILLLPVRPVLQLQVNRLRKAYLLLVFCFGIVACGISAVRLHILTLSQQDADVTWDMAITSYLSTIETSIGILCACVPTLRPLIKRISPALVGSSGKDTSAYGNPTKLDTLKTTITTKHRSTPGTGIYIQKEVDFHSTTELRTNPSSKDPYSIRDRSSDDISVEEINPMSAAKTRNGPPYH